ncbi:hypothetical protein DH2020_004911 [Rehmannia glutinosa]|uniref:PARG catalytic Macro domain-containing protein n=1 Tax=Rehmannia glutinosa TaxID=99300 RepID=A0ABR0XQQ4_REHGL
MESRDDFRSILPFLPLILRSSAVSWPPAVVEVLESISKGPSHSNVNSGQLFALAVADLRNSLGLFSLHSSASLGFSLFFDDLMNKDEAEKWFGEVVPRLADLLLRLPALLGAHYQNADVFNGMETGLRLLESQQSGIVFLSQVHTTGLIEDQPTEALEVDFANKYIGGSVLSRGCVQEEIRFMINPELIVSMLFLPAMADNEAIEIVGAERFSNYTGYATSFRFSGDHVDEKSIDTMGRRRTRIVAIDALCRPGNTQYGPECLVRETNKAFCGFLDRHKPFEENVISDKVIGNPDDEGEIGVATGNWGCGAFGGDPEVKAVIQWLAASQALRPFVLYYTFSLEPLQKLEVVVQRIVSQKWTVGELWNVLVDYSTQRLRGETTVGLFEWLIPSLHDEDPVIVDATHTK